MNIFGFRPFKGKFNLGNSDDIPENQDGTLIGSIKQINTALSMIKDIKILGGQTDANVGGNATIYDTLTVNGLATAITDGYSIASVTLSCDNEGYPIYSKVNSSTGILNYSVLNHSSSSVRITTTATVIMIK